MFKSFKVGKSFIIFVFLLPFMTLISILIYNEYLNTKEKVFSIIEKHLINKKVTLIKNYSNHLNKKLGMEIQSKILNDPKVCQKYEEELTLLQGDEIKYLYLLYRDSDKKFRFLLDATANPKDKAETNQKFDTLTDIWNKAYTTQKVQITKQEELQTLWITIAYPIVVNGKVLAVLGADFTYNVYKQIVNTLSPMEEIYLYVAIFMSIMLVIAYILIYLYYISRKKSFIDPLTQIYNRQYLYEFLQTASLENYQLMMIDLDYFKSINDNYGHDIGDFVLISVVNEIKSYIRDQDLFIRFGGEEFLLLINGQKSDDACSIAERIRESIQEKTILAKSHKLSITISIGINLFPFYAKNIDEAIKIADEQLYHAKIAGRNSIAVSREKDMKQSQTSKRISDVKEAIDNNRIRCAMQPIYSAYTEEIIKYELLLRLIDNEGNIVLPDEFLPSIRHTQVYISVTQIVIDFAIEMIVKNDYAISLNLDLQDILNEDIMNIFKSKFENRKELSKHMSIEILEHEEIVNFDLIKQKLSELKELGFEIAIDDFGSGYANFRYLLHLQVDILKIDGSLIQDLDKDKYAYHIVKTIANFANDMGIKTVAEKVETIDEVNTLKELGIDYLQGYYLAKPSFDYE